MNIGDIDWIKTHLVVIFQSSVAASTQ
jgi:hypothetical protein